MSRVKHLVWERSWSGSTRALEPSWLPNSRRILGVRTMRSRCFFRQRLRFVRRSKRPGLGRARALGKSLPLAALAASEAGLETARKELAWRLAYNFEFLAVAECF